MKLYRNTWGTAALSALVLGAVMGLAACGDKTSQNAEQASAANPAQAPSGKSGDGGQNGTEKLNAYTEGYNKLIGTFGLLETQESYVKENISQKKPTDSISISDGWIASGQEKLKTGRALSTGSHAQLDQAADKLIAALDKLLTQIAALKIYYSSKAYREDSLDKGKAQDPEMLANFEAAVAALRQFNEVLTQEQRKSVEAELEKFKSSGDTLMYHTKLALQKGEQLVSLFENEADIKKPELYTKADALVADLAATLTEQRKEYGAAKAKNPQTDTDYERVASYLDELIGEYRDMKQSKKAEDFSKMVEKYNSAIKDANDIRN